MQQIQNAENQTDLAAGGFERIMHQLADFEKCFEMVSTEEKRNAVCAVIEKIVWDGNRVLVFFPGTTDGEQTVGTAPSDDQEKEKTHLREDSKCYPRTDMFLYCQKQVIKSLKDLTTCSFHIWGSRDFVVSMRIQ